MQRVEHTINLFILPSLRQRTNAYSTYLGGVLNISPIVLQADTLTFQKLSFNSWISLCSNLGGGSVALAIT